MHFTTAPFVFFFLVTLTLSWASRRRPTLHKLILIAASYFFYARLDAGLLVLLAGSSTSNWALGEWMARTRSDRVRKLVLWVGVLLNLGLLGTYKYLGFLQQTVDQIARTFQLDVHIAVIELALPIGISFFTFQSIAYLVDVYRARGVRAAAMLDYLLFTAFFPKLLAGPICRGRELLPQIASGPSERIDLPRAAGLIASGAFKKMALASALSAGLVEDAFIGPENFSSLALLFAAYSYSVLLYCDFSGYTDMARGLALLLGYEIPENFAGPYAATDPGEFWRRWHMTFSSWLREYVYFPLGGSKRGLARTMFNLLVTFGVCGLWHGASWGYVLWGLVHGVGLCVHKLIRDARRALGYDSEGSLPWRISGWFVTFHLVVFSRILFRAGDLETAGMFTRGLLAFSPDRGQVTTVVVLASALGLALNFAGTPIRTAFMKIHARTPRPLVPVLWTLIGIVLLTLQPDVVAPYIYFKF